MLDSEFLCLTKCPFRFSVFFSDDRNLFDYFYNSIIASSTLCELNLLSNETIDFIDSLSHFHPSLVEGLDF